MSAQVKGIVLASRKHFVAARFGDDALEKIIATLPPADRDVVAGNVLPSGWVSMDTAMRFDAAIVAVMGGAAESALRDLGRASAQENLERFQHAFVQGKTPMTFLEQTPAIYRMYYASGSREFVATGERSARLETRDAEGVTEADCETIMGWHECALEHVGAKNIRITHPTCRARGGATCVYELAWD